MLHYHGTPITPMSVLLTLAGRSFCVSHAQPQDIERVHQIGQSVLLDHGGFTKHTTGRPTDWPGYYEWSDRWLDFPTTWAIIPDDIGAGSQEQDGLLREWPHGRDKGAPVWHMNEPIPRLIRLTETYARVCIGSTDEFWQVLSYEWIKRMDEAWNEIARHHRRLPYVHMLRGMQLSGMHWPFASVDSSDIAQNHHRPQNTALMMATRWDAGQTPGRWTQRAPQEQYDLALKVRRLAGELV